MRPKHLPSPRHSSSTESSTKSAADRLQVGIGRGGESRLLEVARDGGLHAGLELLGGLHQGEVEFEVRSHRGT